MLKIDKKLKNLPWLAEPTARLRALVAAQQCPHALLLHGRSGSGRRQLALALVEAVLGTDPLLTLGGAEVVGDDAGLHPDLFVIEPEEGKQSIGVDQVRELISFLALTSHGNNGRIALIWPAERMTIAAANSLLKTLEEPPPGVIVVLISETLRRLPATIVSRCQRIRVPAPAQDVALEWLGQHSPGADLANLLDFCGGAPLAALELHAAGFAKTASSYASDLRDLEECRTSPAEVALRWRADVDLALRWLYWCLSRRVRSDLGALPDKAQGESGRASGRPPEPQNVHACFRQMSQIRELRRVLNGGINAELNLAALLMDWYGGFNRA